MEFFIDTANVDDIKKAYDLGVISGVTTNPSLIAKEGKNFNEVINQITSLVNGPIGGDLQATTDKTEDILNEARKISAIHPNMVVKIPMTKNGLKAVSILSKEGIKTNVTLIFTPIQALLAASAGASYVSPFIGRLDDISNNGMKLVSDIVSIFNVYNINSKIIAASIRNPIHVLECAKIGCDIVTVPYKVICQLIKHPLTDEGIKKFKDDYLESINN